MGFRTLEISNSAEIHVKKGQLEITEQGGTVMIPLEDLTTVICSGANIRMSTMAQSQMAAAGISLLVINEKYQPSCIIMPIESNVRQTLVLRHQINMEHELKQRLWLNLITQKIRNQARALTLLGRGGSEKILQYTLDISDETVDAREASAARDYFHYLHPGLNRRNDDPVNSCLNYGYAVLRNALIRSLILAGFQPSIGLHHDNYLNAFNLADDLIEPWRPFVDVIALQDPGNTVILSRSKRHELAMVLHHACLIQNQKISVQSGIDEMVACLRNIVISQGSSELKQPILIPMEIIEAIKE